MFEKIKSILLICCSLAFLPLGIMAAESTTFIISKSFDIDANSNAAFVTALEKKAPIEAIARSDGWQIFIGGDAIEQSSMDLIDLLSGLLQAHKVDVPLARGAITYGLYFADKYENGIPNDVVIKMIREGLANEYDVDVWLFEQNPSLERFILANRLHESALELRMGRLSTPQIMMKGQWKAWADIVGQNLIDPTTGRLMNYIFTPQGFEKNSAQEPKPNTQQTTNQKNDQQQKPKGTEEKPKTEQTNNQKTDQQTKTNSGQTTGKQTGQQQTTKEKQKDKDDKQSEEQKKIDEELEQQFKKERAEEAKKEQEKEQKLSKELKTSKQRTSKEEKQKRAEIVKAANQKLQEKRQQEFDTKNAEKLKADAEAKKTEETRANRKITIGTAYRNLGGLQEDVVDKVNANHEIYAQTWKLTHEVHDAGIADHACKVHGHVVPCDPEWARIEAIRNWLYNGKPPPDNFWARTLNSLSGWYAPKPRADGHEEWIIMIDENMPITNMCIDPREAIDLLRADKDASMIFLHDSKDSSPTAINDRVIFVRKNNNSRHFFDQLWDQRKKQGGPLQEAFDSIYKEHRYFADQIQIIEPRDAKAKDRAKISLGTLNRTECYQVELENGSASLVMFKDPPSDQWQPGDWIGGPAGVPLLGWTCRNKFNGLPDAPLRYDLILKLLDQVQQSCPKR